MTYQAVTPSISRSNSFQPDFLPVMSLNSIAKHSYDRDTTPTASQNPLADNCSEHFRQDEDVNQPDCRYAFDFGLE